MAKYRAGGIKKPRRTAAVFISLGKHPSDIRRQFFQDMEGLTVEEMAKTLGLEEGTVRVRLSRAGIKPITHSPIYAPEALEAIRNVPGKGRPKKK
jgi:hypothetical protein